MRHIEQEIRDLLIDAGFREASRINGRVLVAGFSIRMHNDTDATVEYRSREFALEPEILKAYARALRVLRDTHHVVEHLRGCSIIHGHVHLRHR